MERELMGESWPAVAKINLFLHITGRREDGYHELQTLFQLLDFGDDLVFEPREDGVLKRIGSDYGIPEEQDLCLRAARLLKEVTGCRLGANIALDKRIPIGAGLGGGSSNAATTLLALNHLWQLGMPRGELATLGLSLGADVPVFVRGRSAWAEGVGEILEPITLPEQWFVVLTPSVSVSTAAVFSHKYLTRDSDAITIRDFRAGQGINQLEEVVRSEYQEVDKLLNWLNNYGDARMTGSGSSGFLPVADESAGRLVLAELPDKVTGFVARGLNEHPLFRI
jgi:4-diphosphocytidyl-2-C-methyl-D-erythritol kinase